jgi:hypothetical protein
MDLVYINPHIISEKDWMIWDKIRGKAYIFIALIAALIFFYPLVFAGQTLYFRDIQAIFYPMKYFLAQSLKSGSIPFWCPLYFCGAPFMSDIQSGVFYFPSLIFLVFSYPLSFNVYIVFHVFLCFCFVYLFIRVIGLSFPAAIFSAIAYSYGGYVLSSINLLNNLTVITWLPAMLWSYQRALAGKSFFNYILTIIFLCLAILGGEPQLFILSVIVTFCFGLVLISKNKMNVNSFMKYNLIFISMIMVALLITIIQWGPTFLDYQHSIRLKGFTFNEASQFSLSWDRLKHLLIPVSFNQLFGSDQAALTRLFPPRGAIPWLLSIYPGFLVVPLALVGVFSKPSRETIFWGIFFLLGIVFALGNNTLLYNFIYKIFPFFRFPEKFYFLANIGLVVLAGYGFESLMSIMTNYGVRTKYILLVVPLVLFADLYIAHANLNLTCKNGFYHFTDPSLKPVLQDNGLFRVYVDEDSFISRLSGSISINERQMISLAIKTSNIGIINNIHYADGHTGMELQYQWIITEILKKSWTDRIRLLQLSNVKYIISAANLDSLPGVMEHVKRINSLLFQIRNNLPRAWMVGEIHPLGAWTLKDYSTRSFNFRTSALGPENIQARHKTPYYQGVDKIVYDDPNHIRIEVTASQRGVVVLSESSYPGWRVTVNGKPANIICLNYLFQGVEVESGRQLIQFEYQPPFFRLYLLISGFTFLVIMLVCISLCSVKRKI